MRSSLRTRVNVLFRLTDLTPETCENEFGDPDTVDDGKLLRALFGDPILVNSLAQRKTDWTIESMKGLTAILELVPLFRQNARAIYLHMDDFLPAFDALPLSRLSNQV